MKSTFTVKKIDCTSCVIAMEGICEDTPGVSKAEVNAREKKLTVEHDDSVKPATLAEALGKEGYPVEPIG